MPNRIRVLASLVVLSLGVAALAMAQTTPVPPPPDIDDLGVAPAASAPPAPPADAPVHVMPAPASTALPPEATPDVDIRHEGDDTIEEYRRNGQLYMVRIVPKHGVPQTFIDADGDGRLDRNTREGPVAPVYYTIYQWGKPPKPAEASSK
jgi:hypothetical protein